MKSRYRQKILLALDYYDYRIHRGVAHIAAKNDWCLVSTQSMAGAVTVPPHWQGDGVISLINANKTYQAIKQLNVPVVELGLGAFDLKAIRVIPDNIAIAKLAAQHFVDKGFNSFIVDSPKYGGLMFEQRRTAFITELNRLSKQHLIHEIDTDSDPAIANLLTNIPRPCAYFGFHDSMSINFIELVRRYGYRIPEDFSVIGVDNNDLLCEGLGTTLTSIETDLEGLGERAAHILAAQLNNKKPMQVATHWHPPLGIVNRQSTDIYAASHPVIIKALTLIEQQIDQGVQANKIATQLGITQQGLQNIFRAHFHCSPAKAINNIRLKRAQSILRQQQCSLKEVAYQCGYQSVDSLCRVFREKLNTTPAKWRAGVGYL